MAEPAATPHEALRFFRRLPELLAAGGEGHPQVSVRPDLRHNASGFLVSMTYWQHLQQYDLRLKLPPTVYLHTCACEGCS